VNIDSISFRYGWQNTYSLNKHFRNLPCTFSYFSNLWRKWSYDENRKFLEKNMWFVLDVPRHLFSSIKNLAQMVLELFRVSSFHMPRKWLCVWITKC